jgi:hypothetical protein
MSIKRDINNLGWVSNFIILCAVTFALLTMHLTTVYLYTIDKQKYDRHMGKSLWLIGKVLTKMKRIPGSNPTQGKIKKKKIVLDKMEPQHL